MMLRDGYIIKAQSLQEHERGHKQSHIKSQLTYISKNNDIKATNHINSSESKFKQFKKY